MEFYSGALIGVRQRSHQSRAPASESRGPRGALRCLSSLPACLFALILSLLQPRWQRKEAKLRRTVSCALVPSFRRRHDRTQLPFGGSSWHRLAQAGTGWPRLDKPPLPVWPLYIHPIIMPLLTLTFSFPPSPPKPPLISRRTGEPSLRLLRGERGTMSRDLFLAHNMIQVFLH